MRRTHSWLDFKVALRMLAKYPGLTAAGVLGMAVAIAIGAAVFSVLHTIHDPALPLDGGVRIVSIQNFDAASRSGEPRTHLHDLQAWRAEVPAVRELGAYRTTGRNLALPGTPPEPLRVAEMTATGFAVARVRPLHGRTLAPDDERPGAAPVVVIGHELWGERFGGRADVVGRTLRLGGEPHTVVGVMPRGFAFPFNHGVWTPLRLDASEFTRGEAPAVEVFGRLAPGASMEQAQGQLDAAGRRLAAAHPGTHRHIQPRVLPYTLGLFGSAALPTEYYLLQVIVGTLLVVTAVNVAILVYARTATRTGEISVRLALGASRGRVVGQLFAEALVLCAAAAAAGLLAAGFLLRQVGAFVSRVAGDSIPFWWSFRLSPGAVAYAAALTVLAALIVGVVPALKVTGRSIQSSLRQLGGGTGMRMGRTWTVLIVAQVAAAVTLLPLAVALGWNEIARAGGGPGFAAETLLSAQVAMDRDTPPTARAAAYDRAFDARLADRQAELVRRLEAEPGVSAVTFASHVPGDWAWRSGAEGAIEVERPGGEPARHTIELVRADPRLFEVYGVPVQAGRALTPADLDGAAVVANRSFVRRVLGGGEALGRRFRYAGGGGPGGGGWYEIVGVVNDFPAKATVNGVGAATVYHPVAPGAVNPVSVVVRAQGIAPAALAGRVREATAALDPALRLSRVEPVAGLYRQRLRAERAITLAIAVATLSVLLLSAGGIHALMSFTVAQRRREIGIRTALGAQPRRILGSIFARALRQLGGGVALGSLLGGALMLGNFTAERTAALLAAVAAIVVAVGMLAALGPARRGLRVEPTEALRADA